jgi:hypothetical protein
MALGASVLDDAAGTDATSLSEGIPKYAFPRASTAKLVAIAGDPT